MGDTLKVNKNAPLTPSSKPTVKTGDTSSLASTLAALGITSIPIPAATSSAGTTVKNPPSSRTDVTQYTPAVKGAPATDASNINSIWRSITGEDPTSKQQNAIIAAINAALKIHPTLTKSSGGVNAAGGAAETVTTTRGADVNEVVKQQAYQAPGAADFQAATTYYDEMLKAIRGPFGGGY